MEMPARTRASARMWMSFMFQVLMFRRAEIDDCGYWSRSTLPISASPVDGHRRRQASSHSPSGYVHSLHKPLRRRHRLFGRSHTELKRTTPVTTNQTPSSQDYQSLLRTMGRRNRQPTRSAHQERRETSTTTTVQQLIRQPTLPDCSKTLSSIIMTPHTSNDIGTHPYMTATRSQTTIIHTTSASVPPPPNSRLLS
ncbi:hypothetical protein PGT21_024920 [Puccinia graminis f. sp. tritici]|uniref:Uncharacterized protein n=1 Tax=Puccinia graminis f. sp. tritici TaxID=56615 RepID=A0A5B0MPS2_PUCGR|nr:hypothetical protein PGT21_024920 [Puccinia graminis f. sp. tritici]